MEIRLHIEQNEDLDKHIGGLVEAKIKKLAREDALNIYTQELRRAVKGKETQAYADLKSILKHKVGTMLGHRWYGSGYLLSYDAFLKLVREAILKVIEGRLTSHVLDRITEMQEELYREACETLLSNIKDNPAEFLASLVELKSTKVNKK